MHTSGNLLWTACAAVLTIMLENGCANFNKDIEEKRAVAGGFAGIEEFNKRTKNLVLDETACPDGLIAAGFDPSAGNVEIKDGARGIRYILGTEQLQISNSNVEDAIHHAAEALREYRAYVFKFENSVSRKDWLYLYEQDESTTGPATKGYIVCRNGKLFSFGEDGERIVDTSSIRKRPLGNIAEPLAIGIGAGSLLFLK